MERDGETCFANLTSFALLSFKIYLEEKKIRKIKTKTRLNLELAQMTVSLCAAQSVCFLAYRVVKANVKVTAQNYRITYRAQFFNQSRLISSVSTFTMAEKLDIILFGATGFTGKHTIKPIVKFSKQGGRNLTWGVAGRSEEKLKKVLEEVGAKLELDLKNIPIIIADVANEESLKKMAARAKVIINTCGPYRFYGEPVIKACVEMGTNHVDVSGEPQYMERMQLLYHKEAQEKGIYIISACGFDSIPTDLGIVFLQQKFEGTVNSIETYLTSTSEGGTSGPAINYGTWESAIYGLAHANELKDLRRKLYPVRTPTFTPKLQMRAPIHKSEVTNGWCLPFLGSDRSVALRSQRFFFDEEKHRPAQVQCYISFDSIVTVFALCMFGLMFKIMCSFQFGRNMLLKHPKFFSFGFFSHENPSEETIEKAKFDIFIHGEGWSEPLPEAADQYKTPMDKAITVKVSGTNPGYGATCTALTLSALMILTESNKMPNKGGVYAPGAAFSKTSLINQLHQNGLTFDVISTKIVAPAKL